MRATTVECDIRDLRVLAEEILEGVEDGAGLDEQTRVLTQIAVRSVVTTMDVAGTARYIEDALDLGLDAAQIQEALTVVSGLGVHTLFESSRQLSSALRRRGGGGAAPLDQTQQNLWDRYIGTDPYWQRMEDELPGFFDALLRMSPETFVAFFDYCAVPWKSRALRAVTKELISLAADSTPTHRYKPGFLLHLKNALDLGAGARSIREVLDISAAAPEHHGVG
ncbi:carboxymuconolactone decarboxylase family protein [Rhodococcus oxybenzonivorans]|uniref:carboxymuconolactone decarboxylase family protein n=1 Tax=Rhodococcus oxybenzonivorans TaxID=1990687 RepID=UPI0029536D3C|nr:carboxymuconolactone decarboxylase family protein [Rhodococcus oxybenzonivorans]MDV7355310.1 carboxymuconolactone decarboxylase family protein [Rhodococcus oxybenzonivorans]